MQREASSAVTSGRAESWMATSSASSEIACNDRLILLKKHQRETACHNCGSEKQLPK